MGEPLPFDEQGGKWWVEIVPAHPEMRVEITLPAHSTWNDYAEAVETAAGVTLGPEGWLLSRHGRLDEAVSSDG